MRLPISNYQDYLNYLSVESLRIEAQNTNHDCTGGITTEFVDSCYICPIIEVASKEELKEIILDLI